MKLGFLASGGLGYRTVVALSQRGVRPEFLFTDKLSQQLISLAIESGIPLYVGRPTTPEAKAFLQSFQDVELIFSINYLFLLDEGTLSIPRFGCINIHGSLLPKYRGRTPHVWAIINNEKQIGITVHYIDSGCDTGDVILQQEIDIAEHVTGSDVLREFDNRYPEIVFKTIALFSKGTRPPGTPQDERLATYFGKRTPADGKIEWTWQKERIYNWIRAQAHPYPGAFAFYEGRKIVIDKIEFSSTGYSWDMPNGYVIIGGSCPEIKTPNGVIRLLNIRETVDFLPGKFML